MLEIVPGHQTSLKQPIEGYANTFYPCCARLQESRDDDDNNDEDINVGFWMDNSVRRTSTDSLIFLWGFNRGISATELKQHLHEAHIVFTDNFKLQLVDKTCAVVVFGRPSSAETLLNDMREETVGSSLPTGMFSRGLKAAGYGTYAKVCRMGFWEADLADSLTRALGDSARDLPIDCSEKGTEIYWCDDSVIELQNL